MVSGGRVCPRSMAGIEEQALRSADVGYFPSGKRRAAVLLTVLSFSYGTVDVPSQSSPTSVILAALLLRHPRGERWC